MWKVLETPEKILRVVLSQYHEMWDLHGSTGLSWHMVGYFGTCERQESVFGWQGYLKPYWSDMDTVNSPCLKGATLHILLWLWECIGSLFIAGLSFNFPLWKRIALWSTALDVDNSGVPLKDVMGPRTHGNSSVTARALCASWEGTRAPCRDLGVLSTSCVYVELSKAPSKDGKCSWGPDVDMDSFASVWAGMSSVKLSWGIVDGLMSLCTVWEDLSPFFNGGSHLKPSSFKWKFMKFPWSEEAGFKLTSTDWIP